MAVDLDAGSAPKGNFVARNLRLQNDSSNDLFPRTPAEAKAGKFHSMYKKDYHDFPPEVLLEGLAPKGQQPERETIRDVLFGQSPTSVGSPRPAPKHPVPPSKACLLPPNPEEQTFSNWRIPKRISGECEDARIGDHIGLVQPEKTATPKLLRQSTLPVIPTTRRESAKTFTPKPRLSATDVCRPPQPLQRARTTLDMPPSRGQDFKARAGHWQQRLPNVDPRLVEKVLRLQDQEKAGSQAVKGTLQPDAKRTVERWMESASESERQVALHFFNSLAGGRLMGDNTQEQNARLKDVISTLQSTGSNRWMAESGLSPRGGAYAGGDAESAQGLKYVHLLDDETRRQRWMHTTWHHLPNYRLVNPVTNWSSHYVRPHKAQHRHFVIHPDWPPE